MTIFELTRKRRLELVALYLSTRDNYLSHGGDMIILIPQVAMMTREQLVAAIVGTRKGAQLLGRVT